MTIPLRLGILNNKDDAGNNDKIPACGFGDGGKWTPLPDEPTDPESTPYVGYWKLNEIDGTEAFDSSENKLPMDYIGTFDLGTKNAPYFDGTTNYLRGENIALYDSTSEISIVVYYSVDSPPNPHAALVSKFIPGSTGVAEAISWGVFLMADGKLQFAVNAGQSVISVNTFFDPAITYKVVFTYDGTNTKLYVNDIEEEITGSMTGNVDKETTHINIGRREDGEGHFRGWIRDVIIYRYVLSIDEVIALPLIIIGSESPSLSPEAKIYRDTINAISYDKTHFGLDEGSVSISSLGIPHTMSWEGILKYRADAIAGQAPLLSPISRTNGIIHSDTFIDNFHRDDYTINIWCYMSTWPIEQYVSGVTDKKATLFARVMYDSKPGYLITIFAPGVWGASAKLKFQIAYSVAGYPNPSIIAAYAELPASIAIDNWFMVTCVANNTAGTVDVYINGQPSNMIPVTFTPGTLFDVPFDGNPRVGARNPNNASVPELFEGYLEELTVVGGALTSAQILNIYNKGNY